MVKILSPLLTFSSTVPFFINEGRPLLSTIRSLDSKLLDCTDYDLIQTLLFGNTSQIQVIISKSLTHQSVISYRVRDLTNHFFT